MSGAGARRLPPSGGRFKKGVSGNPKGRPRKEPQQRTSAYEIVLDRTLTVSVGGKERELTVEEALQLKTYQKAIAGNRTARRDVLKMIEKREKWFAAHRPKHRPPEVLLEEDPENIEEALLVLGIAEPDTSWSDHGSDRRLLLQPWAVQAALKRRGRKKLSEEYSRDMTRSTQGPDRRPPETEE